ncbi:MAG: hypothetical protein ACTSWU_00960 [Candidatus Thorarchaeota archaeon]
MCCYNPEAEKEWWNNASDIEKIETLIAQKIVSFVNRNNKLVGVDLCKAHSIRKRGRYVRVRTEFEEAYFKKDYFVPIANFCKVDTWYLTEERYNKKHDNRYRLLVGITDENKCVVLAPVKADSHVKETFEEVD